MVGKIKRIRQKLHQGAVKLEHATAAGSTLPNLEKAPTQAEVPSFGLSGTVKTASLPQRAKTGDSAKDIKTFSSFPSGIFSGTKITPESLVQTLKFDEPTHVVPPVLPTGEPRGSEPKKQQSKKEKMRERRERWLKKISAIKLAKEQQAAQARRKATPVVGDMRPLVDALPELSQLLPTTKTTTRRKTNDPVKKRAEPTDFSLMKPTQKRKFLETETSRFSEAMKNPAFRTGSLAAIGEHLRKRLKQEDEQSPS
ncbi:ribosome biogenesis protein SLX9 homolog [Chanos chanos]|uniref:Ribosome biogenesis protein SLX9 homolog n=1 Tax=Chanos chanos TaxID=29144 RepID=A0A6J2V6B3_CHACN|nr:protein FAM207A [Chanos chanos]